MRNKRKQKQEPELDDMDKFLYDLAKKDFKPIPKDIHDNIMKTIENLDFDEKAPTEVENKLLCKKPKFKLPLHYRIKERLGTIITKPAHAVLASFLIVSLVATGAVGAREMSDKFFGKDTVRLTNIGIANEFTFTDEMERALVQNVPLNLVQLNEDYYISIHSILLDEINFFTVFDLHSEKEITDDLKFTFRDLKISDENGNVLYDSYIETNPTINTNSGYNNIYNTSNSIRTLFFMFGNDNSQIQELNYTFSNIDIYMGKPQLNLNSDFEDIHINTESKTITIPIAKDNYNTIQKYEWDKKNSNSKYNIENAIITKTGLYITMLSPSLEITPIIKASNKFYTMSYNLPLKRSGRNNTLYLLAYNITEYQDNLVLYNNLDKNKYNLIPVN